MKCHLENREELIGKYLLNELSDEESLKFEEHYFQCKECFNELRAAEDAIRFIKSNKFSEANESVKQNFLDKIFGKFFEPVKWGIAFASIIILIVVAYTIFNESPEIQKNKLITKDESDSLKNSIHEESPSEIIDKTRPQKENNNLIAQLSGAEFNVNPYYEELITENIRAYSGVLDKVISPAIGDTISDSHIFFKFRLSVDQPVSITLLDNKEEKIFSDEVDNHQFPDIEYKVNTAPLKPALYYWRIEDENEVLYISKFYFVKSQ